jgi:phage N-6-adenine-methyltransferase
MAGFEKNRFSQTRTDWPTPLVLFNKLNKEFNFTLDPCADKSNAKCNKYFSKEDDGLKQSWYKEISYVNPPYGPGMVNWLKKALSESNEFDTVVICLIPARTNTRWWHDICMKAYEIRFICGRPKFGDAKHGLPQPLALIVFKKHSLKTPLMSSFEL